MKQLLFTRIIDLCKSIVVLFCFMVVFTGNTQATDVYPTRIVSMAPSITEILFALGLADRVVGVTRYCDWPPEAKTKPQIGGYVDPNYEAVLVLRPDLVVLLESHADIRTKLSKLGLKTLSVKHETLSDIKASIMEVGKRCGVRAQAEAVNKSIDIRIEAIREKVAGTQCPLVLVSVGRDNTSKRLGMVYVAGPSTFYSEVIQLAGGKNAIEEGGGYPQLSIEGLIRINPDVIIDLVGEQKASGLSPETIRTQWETLGGVNAVKSKRIYVISDNYALHPGPRFPQLVETFAKQIHPEASWGVR